MARYGALQAVIFLIPAVFLFDRIHQRNRHYRRLREMYEGLKTLHGK